MTNKPLLCRIPLDELDVDQQPKTAEESDGTGGTVRVDRFPDGSSVTHFGGPCGSVRTDQYGEEC